VYIFVGGFNDAHDKNVQRYYDTFKRTHPGQAYYFSWVSDVEIKKFIASQPAGTPVNLIGHSYGADTAAKIVEQSDKKINMLITIDPVSLRRPDFAVVRSNTNTWIDVDAAPTEHSRPSNVLAGVGGDWGTLPKEAATIYIKSAANHEEFTKMMQTEGPDKRHPTRYCSADDAEIGATGCGGDVTHPG
jgi:predicted alpha/beta hydrolase family esterase